MAGDGPRPEPITGTVELGRYVVEVGAPSGAAISRSAETVEGDARPLARALEKDGKRKKHAEAVTAALGDAVDQASEVTAKVERAGQLFRGVAEGKVLDPEQLSIEIDSMLTLLERLDRQGRFKEALRVARALSGLLALLRRWSALLRSLTVALQAAEKIGDLDAIAWAKHELGTLQVAAENAAGAERSLREAREIRERLGDRRGLAATDRSLQVQCQQLRELLREGKLVQRRGLRLRVAKSPLLVAIIAAVVLGLAGVAAGVVGGGGDETPAAGGRADGEEPVDDGGANGEPGVGDGRPADGGSESNELSVTVEGSGTVTSDPAGIDCPKTCRQELPADAELELTAEPVAGSEFAGWSGDCFGIDLCAVSMEEAKSVEASFVPDECHDGEDNDGDGRIDVEQDQGCGDGTEAPHDFPVDDEVG